MNASALELREDGHGRTVYASIARPGSGIRTCAERQPELEPIGGLVGMLAAPSPDTPPASARQSWNEADT